MKSREFNHCLCFILFLLILPFQFDNVSGAASWDGVVVTQSDFQSLRAIKNELIDFYGVLQSWNDTHEACSGKWAGIRCLKGQVIAIQLPWKGLGGRISEKIGQLQSLRKLSLHDNVLAGPVPWSLSFLPNLRGVYLFNNRLSGSIPPSIGNCFSLQSLDLSNNLLTGVIPPSLANATRLYRLNLSFNSFSGHIPSSLLTKSRSLSFLALEHNNFSGSVPDSWYGSSHQLQSLTLDHNSFSGFIPSSLKNLGLLRDISLSHNKISGSIPFEIGNLKNLKRIDFSYNVINGSIPSSFSNLSSLETLNLEENRIDGQLPKTLENLQNLTVLNLKSNKLNGDVPSSIGNISGISQIDLSENNFTGGIPESFSKLVNLVTFNVSYNNLSGSVPGILSTKFNSSSFVGNIQLCGYSVKSQCPSLLSPPPSSVVTPLPLRHQHRIHKLKAKDIILIAIGALLAVLLLLCCILLCCLMRKRAASKQNNSKAVSVITDKKGGSVVSGTDTECGGDIGGKLVHFDGTFVFTADDLLCATAEIMGKSTYGTAYKATLEDGNQVAVKRLREKTTKSVREFEAEAAPLGKIRHPNLLALRAYYLGPKGEKLLVFDYMSKGSLASFLHARGPETTIDWTTRMKIATATARGLSHLHNKENMIHGNLTSSNILLDEQNNAHIADYGLSSLMTSAATTNVIATAGTLGYRAPEFSKLKNASTKTDVYSLGVIILELLTGKSPGEPMNGVDLPQWVACTVKEEWTNEVFDLELMREIQNYGDEFLNTLKLALHCVDPSPVARPEVRQVLQQLEEIRPQVRTSLGDDGAKD